MTSWFHHHKQDQPAAPANAPRHSLYDEPDDVIHESWLVKDADNPFNHHNHALGHTENDGPEDGVLASMAALCAMSSLVSVMHQLNSTTPNSSQ